MTELRVKIRARQGNFTLDVNTGIPLRGVSGIYGPSGCGKTSLLYSLAGLQQLEPGSHITMDDTVWQSDSANLPTFERQVGLVFQDARLFPHLNVRGNLEYAHRRAHRVQGPDLRQVCDWLALEPLLARQVDELSRGQQQRVAIARTLLNHPRILLLDEPLANIDISSRLDIMRHLHTISRELDIPIVCVSHNMEELAALANWLIVMQEGKIIAEGAMLELCNQLELALAHEEQAAAIVSAKLVRQDDVYNLSELDFEGQDMFISSVDASPNATIRLRIPARDISLCLQPPAHTSILNILQARIVEIEDSENSRVLVRLQVGKQHLLARVTRKSIAHLELGVGTPVYAQIKSVALLSESRELAS